MWRWLEVRLRKRSTAFLYMIRRCVRRFLGIKYVCSSATNAMSRPTIRTARIKGEYPDADQAALEYEKALCEYFKLKAGEYPRFDLVLAGMGNEGHTLSLFPGTKALHADGRIAVRNWIGKLYTERITLTAPAASNAAHIIFMVTGADKAPALKAVLEGPFEPDQLPAQLLQPQNGKLLWLVDTTAGSMLTSGIRD